MRADVSPKHWLAVPLKEMVRKLVDGSHNPPEKKSQGLPMLSAVNISGNRIHFSTFRLIDPAAFAEEDKRTNVQPGDVLLTIVGAIGRAAVVPASSPRFTLQRSVAVLSPIIIDPKFLMYQIEAPRLSRHLEANARGTAQKGVYLGTLGEVEVWLPPFAEQGRIVAKIEELLSELAKGVESLTAAREQLKAYRQSVLKHAFQSKLTADWRAQNPDKLENPEAIRDRIREARAARYAEDLRAWEQAISEWHDSGEAGAKPRKPFRHPEAEPLIASDTTDLPALPTSWAYANLGEFLERIEAGHSFKCDEREPGRDEIGVAKVSAVTWGEYDEAESKTCMDKARVDRELFIREGDFLLSRANTIDLVGACVIVRNVTKSVMLSDKTLRLHFDAGNKRFFLHYLRSITGRAEIEKRSTGNQESMRNIGQDRIRSLVVPLCSDEEMTVTVVRLEAQLSEITRLEEEAIQGIQKAEALRQSILRKAFSGQLVPQDPNDEPASVLLERIRTERESNSSKPKKTTTRTKGEAA